MEPAAYLDTIRAESAGLVEAAARAGLDAPVPSCPDWSVADLLIHVGRVQRWHAGLVTRRVTEPEFQFEDPPDDADALVGWVRDATNLVVTAFTAVSPEEPMWTFFGPGRVSFWIRRQAHEVSMHRCDAELAAGDTPVIDRDLARDGIDEFFDLADARFRDRFIGDGETVHLHCTDGDGEWLVRLTTDGPDITRAHAKGDVAARGSASDLLLVLRGRIPPSSVEVFGDAALLDRFVDLSRH